MAEAKTTATKKVEEEREIFIPKSMANANDSFYISINNRSWLIPVGKKTKVPLIVAEHFDQICEAMEMLDESIEALKPKDTKGL